MPMAGCGAAATAAAKAAPLVPGNVQVEAATPASRARSTGSLKARWMGSIVRAGESRLVITASLAAASRELDDGGVDRRTGIALDDPLLQPAAVEGRGEAVGVPPLGSHRPGQVDEMVRGLDVEPVPRRVVDLIVRRGGQLSGVARR